MQIKLENTNSCKITNSCNITNSCKVKIGNVDRIGIRAPTKERRITIVNKWPYEKGHELSIRAMGNNCPRAHYTEIAHNAISLGGVKSNNEKPSSRIRMGPRWWLSHKFGTFLPTKISNMHKSAQMMRHRTAPGSFTIPWCVECDEPHVEIMQLLPL